MATAVSSPLEIHLSLSKFMLPTYIATYTIVIAAYLHHMIVIIVWGWLIFVNPVLYIIMIKQQPPPRLINLNALYVQQNMPV